MKRRDFFKISAPLLSTPVLLNSTSVSAFNSFDLFNMLDCTTVRDRFVVMVQLKGANDGLNTVIRPENDGLYQTHRNDIYIPQNTLLSSSESAYDAIRLHPNLGKIRDLCNAGSVNIIESVGYPTMNRSHFKATDLWLTGSDGVLESDEGWMGKYLEYIYGGYEGTPNAFMPDPLGIHLKAKSQSLGYHTESEHLAAINLSSKDANNYYTILSENSISNQNLGDIDCTDHIAFMKQLDKEAQVYGSRISQVFDRGCNSSINYGTHDLGYQLKTVARLVAGGCRTKLFLTEMTGFDTHVNQITRHGSLMTQLSESVHNFMADLDLLGLLDRCLIVTFSEFGRKFHDNASAGTDHGTLAPMFVFGHPDKINAGLTGPPILVDAANIDAQGAPIVTASNNKDYRDVFSGILKQWLGAEQAAVDEAFSTYSGNTSMNLVNNSDNADGTPGCYVPGTQMDTEQELTIEVPIIQEGYVSGGIAPPGMTSKEPLQEITACNYVDLKPGFVLLSAEEDILFTKVKEEKNEIKLIENSIVAERVKVKLFPNPATEYINVSFKVRQGENTIRLEILDGRGAIVPVQMPSVDTFSGKYEVRINVGQLQTGYYYLRYLSKDIMETFKFFKQ